MNIKEIDRLIDELKDADTTAINCTNLAALYIIRDNFNQGYLKPVEPQTNIVMQELNDILPQYTQYVDAKTKYQLGEIGEELVIKRIQAVCRELEQFIQVLYSSTDLPDERVWIKQTIKNLQVIGT